MTWKHKALRHSFVSYRLAAIQNIPQVAVEAGNSPQMILKHYRELVRPKAAKDWFAITPKSVAAAKAKADKERAAKTTSFQAAKAAALQRSASAVRASRR